MIPIVNVLQTTETNYMIQVLVRHTTAIYKQEKKTNTVNHFHRPNCSELQKSCSTKISQNSSQSLLIRAPYLP